MNRRELETMRETLMVQLNAMNETLKTTPFPPGKLAAKKHIALTDGLLDASLLLEKAIIRIDATLKEITA